MPYVLTPLAKANVFDIWSYIADDNEDAADRVEQAIFDACEFYCGGSHAGPFPARPHNALPSLLDSDPLSKLLGCVPAGDDPA
jgi:plasmid stabilization system protein ParE